MAAFVWTFLCVNVSALIDRSECNMKEYLCSLCIRVSQKIQKSEFWNATYPSGFHRLDEPPEKISAL